MKKIIHTIVIMFFFSLSLNANSSKYDNLFQEIGEKYDIPPILLKAIALTENRQMQPTIVKKNKNGTRDIGLMQINTIHIKSLKRLKLSTEKLKDPRTNIEVAAILLSKIIQQRGYSWDAIGVYHSKTKKYKRRWLKKVKKNLAALRNREKQKIYLVGS